VGAVGITIKATPLAKSLTEALLATCGVPCNIILLRTRVARAGTISQGTPKVARRASVKDFSRVLL
jgi:hypothetical protein